MVTNFAHRMVGGQDFQAIVGAAQHRIRFLFWNCCPHYLKKLAHVCSLGDLVGRGWNQLTRLHRLVCIQLSVCFKNNWPRRRADDLCFVVEDLGKHLLESH